MSIVLILGSGPNVVACRDWPRAPFDRIVAINNAWAVRPDWDDLIHPDDFPAARMPVDIGAEQRIIHAGWLCLCWRDHGIHRQLLGAGSPATTGHRSTRLRYGL